MGDFVGFAFVLMIVFTVGFHYWCKRDPGYREAYRDWGRFRDLFGINLLLKYPVCRLAPFVAMLVFAGMLAWCGD